MIRQVAALLAFIILTAGVRLHYITYEYPDLDQAEAMYHAQKILTGSILYRDSFTHHHPGAIIGAVLSRVILGPSHLATNWFCLALTMLTGGIVFLTLLETVLPFAAMLGALICTIAYFPVDVPYYPQTITTVFVATLLWLHVCTRHKAAERWFIRGLICGFAFAADQRCALLILPVAWEVIGAWQKMLVRTCLIFLGILVGIAPLLLYLILGNAVSDYFYQCWVFPATLRAGGIDIFKIINTGFTLHTLLNGGIITAALAGLCITIKKTIRPFREFGYLTLFALALFSIAAAGNETFSNYLIVWFPFLGLLTGQLFGSIEAKFTLGKFLSAATAGLILLLSIGSTEVKSIFDRPYFRYAPQTSQKVAAEYIKNHMSEDQDLYVWGYYPQFYLYADKLSRFRHVNQIAITGAYFSDAEAPSFEPTDTSAFHEFRSYLTKTPPKYFVIYDNAQDWKTFDQRITQAQSDPKNHLYQLATFIFGQLESGYVLEQTYGNFKIYRAKI